MSSSTFYAKPQNFIWGLEYRNRGHSSKYSINENILNKWHTHARTHAFYLILYIAQSPVDSLPYRGKYTHYPYKDISFSRLYGTHCEPWKIKSPKHISENLNIDMPEFLQNICVCFLWIQGDEHWTSLGNDLKRPPFLNMIKRISLSNFSARNIIKTSSPRWY